MDIISVIGPTNAGKSTFMNAVREAPRTALIEIGKWMRAKYPPSYFKGSGSPRHTEKEAWGMLLDGLCRAKEGDMDRVLIDGQPRNGGQAALFCLHFPQARFILLDAPHEVREGWARHRDGDDPEKMALTTQRLESDYRDMYDTIKVLVQHHMPIHVIDTTGPDYDPREVLE